MHYNAAIVALSPPQSPAQCDPWSPTSSTTSPPSPYSRRRSSVSSDRSAASSVTSLGDDSSYQAAATLPKSTLRHARNDSVLQTHEASKTSESNTASAPRPQTPQQFYFTANISSFVRMLEAHRAGVRDRKEKSSVPTVRFNMPSPRPSPTRGKAPGSRERGSRERRSMMLDDEEDQTVQARRESRRNVVFRPRFDPRSTQKLCNEALAELIE